MNICKNIFDKFPDLKFIGIYNTELKSIQDGFEGNQSNDIGLWADILIGNESDTITPESFEIKLSSKEYLIIRELKAKEYLLVSAKKENVPIVNSFINNELPIVPRTDDMEQIDVSQIQGYHESNNGKSDNYEMNQKLLEAKRMQDMILPKTDILDKHFLDHFLIYEPKDFVGGDFYWFKENTDGTVVIIVADCTGHSLEGAMASMTINSLINQVFVDEKTSLTEKIVSIYDSLQVYNRHDDGLEYSIGVEMAILKFDFKKRKLHFVSSGVKCIISDVEELKLMNGKPMRKFEQWKKEMKPEEVIDLQDGMWVNVFSDGITDQFDSNDIKKLGNKRLQAIIKNSNAPSLDYFEKEFKAWRGNTEPFDDITFLGLKV